MGQRKRRLAAKRPLFSNYKGLSAYAKRAAEALKDSRGVMLVAVVGIGLATLLYSKAATSTVSLEPESAACASMIQSNAQASGGSFVRFAQNQCISGVGSDFYPKSDCSIIPIGQYCIQRMGLGAGGWMSGIDVGVDDTIAMRTDASVPVVLEKDSAGKDIWLPLLTKSSLPSSITSDPNWAPKQAQSAASEIAVYNKNLIYYRSYHVYKDENGVEKKEGLIWKADKSSGSWKLSRITSSNPTLETNLYMDPNEQPGVDSGEAPGAGVYDLAGINNVRFRSKYMVISKTNPNIIYATAFDGIWRTGDAGSNWTKVYSWDANVCKQLYNGCASLIINESTGKIYAFIKKGVPGYALMSDGLKVLSGNVSGGNLNHTGQTIAHSVANVVYDSVGTIYFTNELGDLYKMNNSGTITLLTTADGLFGSDSQGPRLIVGITAKKDGQTIAVAGGSAHTYAISNNQGSTWSKKVCCDVSGASIRSSDVPWMLSPNRVVMDWGGNETDTSTLSTIAYVGDRIWLADGIGAYYRDPGTPDKDWIGLSRGIENMINQNIRAFKDLAGKGRVIWTEQDRGGMIQKWANDISEVASPATRTYSPPQNLFSVLRHGQGPGTSPNGKYVVTSYYTHDRITCSSDGGDTVRVSDELDSPWKVIGSWAINNSGLALFVPYNQAPGGLNGQYGVVDCNANKPVMTLRNLPGNIQYRYDGVPASYAATKILASVDDNNIFYMATHWGTGSGYNADLNAFNIYSSSDLTSWQTIGLAGPMNDAIFGGKIKAVNAPGSSAVAAGTIFVTNGDTSGVSAVCGPAAYVRAPGTSTFKPILNVSEVLDFGFGLPATAGAFPQVYISGCYNDVYGIWTATDFNPSTGGATWTRVDNDSLWKNPTAQAGAITGIDGDKVRVGCFYAITREHGGYYGCKK